MIRTVAPVRFAESTSVIVMFVSIAVAGSFSVYASAPAELSTSGALSVALTLIVRVAGADESAPSLAMNVTVRGSVLGLLDVLRYVTVRSAAWKTAGEAGPVSVSVPVPESYDAKMPSVVGSASTSSPLARLPVIWTVTVTMLLSGSATVTPGSIGVAGSPSA